jgi:formylglycine-generating enzyme required for sulfatase activity
MKMFIGRVILTAIGLVTAQTLRSAEAQDITNSIGMKLVRVEAGSFLMGQDGPPADYQTVKHADRCDQADWDERPAHRVNISHLFYLGSTEVTNAQYRQFKPGRNPKDNDDEAVIFVNWNDATKFCAWLSAKEGRTYRLPTEAEWEYACRAGTTTLFHTGDRLPDGFQKWRFNDKFLTRFFPKTMKYPPEYRNWPAESPLRVGQTPANAWGLFDMHGNVEEWCLDWYGPYESGEQSDPVGRIDGDFRVTRGGSHSDFARMLRSANRSGRLPTMASDKIGFRVVLGEAPTTAPLSVPPPSLNAQDVSQVAAPPAEKVTKPFFSGPKQFVKVPPNMAGPMFSNHNHSPSIAECPNGDLLAVWFSCGDEGGPELWFDGAKTLFFFAKSFAGDIVRTSTDSGATWAKARLIQPEVEIGNLPVRTREGILALPLDRTPLGAAFNISRDGGRTWVAEPGHGKPDYQPGGQGSRFAGIHNATVQLNDGRLMAFGRFDEPEIQEKFHFHTPVSYTNDLGKTWTYEESSFPAISTVQRAVLVRLHEGPLLLCSYTDQLRNWKNRVGLDFKAADGSEFKGYGLFAAVSFDEGKTWPIKRLVTPGGEARTVPGVDRNEFTLSDTMAEPSGYLSVCQTRDDLIQLISSKNHYVFNLGWLKELPPAPRQ